MRKLSLSVRLVLGFVLGGAALAAILLRPRGTSEPASPNDCLRLYYDAFQAGDLDRFTSCLSQPLQAKARSEFGDANTLRLQAVKSWISVAPTESGGHEARLDVDEVRESGVRRVRFQLERAGRTWLITAITPLEDRPSSIPYGKDIRDP